MPEPLSIVVAEGVRKERADKIVCAAHPDLSRAAVQRVFEASLVQVRGQAVPKNHRVSAGDRIEYSFPEVAPTELVAAEIPLDVLFEDDDLIVLNKPAGMVVHPGAATGGDTLVHALLAHCRGQLSGIGGVERPGIVHRLDRETSGVMLAAKSDRAHRRLARAFARREVGKEYLALVSGVPELLSGTVLKPIARNKSHRHRMTVAAEGEGREAHTDWTREAAYGRLAALVRCEIHTGRTHQIRVHMKAIGHPLLGDEIYGWRADPRYPLVPGRVMLHAARLTFTHPTTDEPCEFEAPPPADFRAVIEALERMGKPVPGR